jgi:hypothetical protein
MDSTKLVPVLVIFAISTLDSLHARDKTEARKGSASTSNPAHIQQSRSSGASNKNSSKNSKKDSKANSAVAAVAPLNDSKAALEAMEVERVTGLEQASLQANFKKDEAWFRDYLADDLTFTNPDGVVEDKARLIARSVDPANTVESKTYDQLTVRPYGEDVIIATGKLSEKGRRNNADYTVQRAFTHVWVNRLGQWQEVAIQESPISPAGSASRQSPAPATGETPKPQAATSPAVTPPNTSSSTSP